MGSGSGLGLGSGLCLTVDVDSDGVAPPAPGLTPVGPTVMLLRHVEEAAQAGGNSPVLTHLHL